MRRRPALTALLAVALCAARAQAGPFDVGDEAAPSAWRLGGLLDLRYARTSQNRAWLAGGPGKLRYGGRDIDNNGTGDRDAHVLAVPRLSLVVDGTIAEAVDAHVQLNFDADTDASAAAGGIGEVFARWRRDFSMGSVDGRAGVFVPSVSWEHPEFAWSTRYTITPSAFGSWLSEEVRVSGVQAMWESPFAEKHALRAKATVFGGCDAAGTILLERGWALHDYMPELSATLSLPGTNRTYKPFRERDGRLGGSARLGAALWDRTLELEGGAWDNNGDINARSAATGGGAWSTQFWDFGGKLVQGRWTLLSQAVFGRSGSPAFSRRSWETWYALGSAQLRQWTLSGRYDRFWIQGPWEAGYAVTGTVQYELGAKHRLALEYVHAYAKPTLLRRSGAGKDQTVLLNYRARFGQ